ncbi:phage antirepressor N-terminal domain-containing protein [Thomasclavelia cocleata]|uniref:phage antirepressor N-terminal domain-containing protein n=1 Tax=Thomasclavelia cocleata TaxID=69824 RepID=UPI002617A1D0|nr:phage antirepressor N-terminal domain-containing protein [Thomasclavelia cocleata]
MTNNNTALQVTNFNFYGDELIALKDNTTGEIYTSINSVLRGIGFSNKDQIRKRREKWINDVVISKGVVKFNIPTQEVVAKNDTTLFDEKDTYCISQHKLPLALAKINITPKMKQNQSALASKLELYQDKCADVLASVFLDNKTTDQITMQPILDTLNIFTKTVNDTLLLLNERMSKLEESQEQVKKSLPKKRFSYWSSKMFPKYQLLMDYFEIPTGKNGILYQELYKEFHNMYPDIEINQVVDDYCYDNGLDSCFTLDAIEHDKTVRKLFESLVDGLLEKYDLISENVTVREKTIFDD